MISEINIVTFLAQWAFVGLFICFIIQERIEWKRDSTRRLFIFAMGPACWIIYTVHLFLEWLAFKVIEKETGFKKDDWTE